MIRFTRLAAGAALAIGMTSGSAHAIGVFTDDFNGAVVAPQWSTNVGALAIATAANAPNAKYLGGLGNGELGLSNQIVTLSLAGLAAHTEVTLTFDMIVIRTMDGNEPFTVTANGFGTVIDARFENLTSGGNPLGGVDFGNGTAPFGHADAENSLGITPDANAGAIESALYRRSFTFDHSTADLILNFQYGGLQGLADESWAIDNVLIETDGRQGGVVPLPAALPLMAAGIGAFGLMGWRRKRSLA